MLERLFDSIAFGRERDCFRENVARWRGLADFFFWPVKIWLAPSELVSVCLGNAIGPKKPLGSRCKILREPKSCFLNVRFFRSFSEGEEIWAGTLAPDRPPWTVRQRV